MGQPLPADLLRFLRRLRRNNNREWFQEHKKLYESQVRDPLLRFVRDFAPHLKRVSPHFVADDRPVGGSLFRIYRDTRFSRDKSPYKTWAAVQFRHERGKDVHAPGFYLHIEPGNIFAGCGLWRPDGATLAAIRDAIVEEPAAWKRIMSGKAFRSHFELSGESLKRPARGYDPEHPLIEDIKRKDFVAVTPLTEPALLADGFATAYAGRLRAAKPFMRFLTHAVGLLW